jgi:hypothetical protein
MDFVSIIKKIDDGKFLTIIGYVLKGNYKKLWQIGHLNDLFSDYIEFEQFVKQFYSLLAKNEIRLDRSANYPKKKDIIDLIKNDLESEVDLIEDQLDEFLHTKEYYYNQTSDEYIVHLPSKPKPFILKGTFWRSVVSAYSNWDKQPNTINQMCRKFSMSRRTMVELLRVMGVTHDSSPYTEEVLHKTSEEDLVFDLLRRKEERVLLQAEQKEYKRVQKDAYKYRSYKKFVESIKFLLEDIDISIEEVKHQEKDDDFSVLVSPTDFHWGKYASILTGDEYNRDIAKERLFKTTTDVLDRVLQRGIPDKIIVAIGGDGLHIDNQSKSTTRGTPQDCDGTPVELAASYVRLCIEYINMIRQYAPVECYVVSGNHDYYTSAILREAIRAWFRNVEFVKIDEKISTRRTFLYGNSLITLMHGDMGSTKDFPAIIAGENAEIWGKSKQRFIFTGHLHTERELPTFGNITVYRMPSLAGTDDWHWQKGYKSRKALIGYIIDKDRGVIATEISPC